MFTGVFESRFLSITAGRVENSRNLFLSAGKFISLHWFKLCKIIVHLKKNWQH